MNKHDHKKILKCIAKAKAFLVEREEAYMNQKRELFNLAGIVEYMYNKPLIRLNKLSDLIIEYDSSVRTVRIGPKNSVQIRSAYYVIRELSDIYQTTLNKLNHYLVSIGKSKTSRAIIPTYQQFSKPKRIIAGILQVFEDKNIVSYVYDIYFDQSRSHTSAVIRPTVNFSHDLKLDFFGAVYKHNQLVLYCIQYDDESHFDMGREEFLPIHQQDIILQFVLFQLSINLLRIRSIKSIKSIKSDIKHFINRIQNTTEYITIGAIQPITEFFPNEPIDSSLKIFCQDYNLNKNIYLKWLKTPTETTDSDDEFYESRLDPNFVDDDPDQGIGVDSKTMAILLDEKEAYHPDRDTRTKSEIAADRIVVQLMGYKDQSGKTNTFKSKKN
jgi:hypothetical protein